MATRKKSPARSKSVRKTNARKSIWRPILLLRQARMARAVSQSELAERIGVSQARIAEWENGARFPSWGVLKDLGVCLGCETIADLIDPASRFDTENTASGAPADPYPEK